MPQINSLSSPKRYAQPVADKSAVGRSGRGAVVPLASSHDFSGYGPSSENSGSLIFVLVCQGEPAISRKGFGEGSVALSYNKKSVW